MAAALIIAAGKTAYTDGFQPLKKVGVITAVQRIVGIFQRAGIERVVLVVGPDAQKTEKHVSGAGVICLRNPDYETAEMLDSIKIGLRYLEGKCEGVCITPVDTPLFSVETVLALVQTKHDAAVPVCAGKAGHPLFLASRQFSTVLRYGGENGLEGALASNAIEAVPIDVADEGVLLDVEREASFDRLLASHSMRSLHPDVAITLACETAFFDKQAQQLLSAIDETHSIRLACQRLGISYSKGWKWIGQIEGQLGFTVVDSKQGGKSGGVSVLTDRGRALVDSYCAFCAELKGQVSEAFARHFKDFLPR